MASYLYYERARNGNYADLFFFKKKLKSGQNNKGHEPSKLGILSEEITDFAISLYDMIIYRSKRNVQELADLKMTFTIKLTKCVNFPALFR